MYRVLQVAGRRSQVAGDRVRAVAELHVRDLGCVAVQRQILQLDLSRFQGFLRAYGHGVGARVLVEYVERQRRGHADAAALADREAVLAVVAPEGVAPLVDYRAWGVRDVSVARQEVRG